MAVGATVRRPAGSSDWLGKRPGYSDGIWIAANTDLKTAQTLLLNPYTIADAGFHWVEVPYGATRMYVRGRVTVNMTTLGQDPAFAVVGISADPTDTGTTNATTKALRLDNADWNAAGVSFGFAASGANLHTDATDFITDVVPTTLDLVSGYPIQGSAYVGVVVTTAGVCGVATSMRSEILFVA